MIAFNLHITHSAYFFFLFHSYALITSKTLKQIYGSSQLTTIQINLLTLKQRKDCKNQNVHTHHRQNFLSKTSFGSTIKEDLKSFPI